eukprot:3431337-Pleurochrysis_carterae.AAC.1
MPGMADTQVCAACSHGRCSLAHARLVYDGVFHSIEYVRRRVSAPNTMKRDKHHCSLFMWIGGLYSLQAP